MMKKSMTVALAGLMATAAMAETATKAAPAPTAANAKKKKIVQKKPLTRKAVVTKKEAREDHLNTPQSSAISASNATTSMPALTAGTSAAQAPKALKKKTFVDNVRAGVLFEYYGASIADPLSGQQTDKDKGYGQSGTSQELDTTLTLGYALSSNFTLTYNAYFWAHSNDAGKDSGGETFRYRAADSYLKLAVGKILQNGRFKWNGDLRLAPAFGNDRPYRDLYVRNGHNFMYSITPRLTLASYNTIRYYLNKQSAYNDDERSGNLDRPDLRITVSPAIEYQLFDSAGVSLSYNMDFAHTHLNNTFTESDIPLGADYGAYFELGSAIDITKSINFNPYIDMYTNSFNVDAMQFGANLNFSIL